MNKKKKKIMLIDDDPTTREFFKIYFNKHFEGELKTYDKPDEAVEELKKTNDYGLILMNLQFELHQPNGIEATK